jgi:hypothetical protein
VVELGLLTIDGRKEAGDKVDDDPGFGQDDDVLGRSLDRRICGGSIAQGGDLCNIIRAI